MTGSSITNIYDNENGDGLEKSYKCRFCNKLFPKSQALGGHMNCHHIERTKEKIKHYQVLVQQNPTLIPLDLKIPQNQGVASNPIFRTEGHLPRPLSWPSLPAWKLSQGQLQDGFQPGTMPNTSYNFPSNGGPHTHTPTFPHPQMDNSVQLAQYGTYSLYTQVCGQATANVANEQVSNQTSHVPTENLQINSTSQQGMLPYKSHQYPALPRVCELYGESDLEALGDLSFLHNFPYEANVETVKGSDNQSRTQGAA